MWSHFEYMHFSRRVFLAITCKHDVVHKPEVRNVSQRHEEDRAMAMGNIQAPPPTPFVG